MRKNGVRALTIFFLCIVPIWMILCRDRVFSPKENRNLAGFPKVTWSSVLNGDFMDDFETYLADQFPIRDWCISVKTTALRITGKRFINDVYIADDGYLIAEESSADNDRMKELTEAVNGFAAECEGTSVSFMLVPNSSLIYEDRLPYGAKSGEDEFIDSVKEMSGSRISFVDVRDTLREHGSEGMFYKTDHHWTTRGAYYAFLEYADTVNIEPSEYEFYNVTNAFQGTQASNSGIYSTYDGIEICVPAGDAGHYVVDYTGTDTKTATLFNTEKLSEKDKYLVFQGGNYSQLEITTDAGTGRNLMIIKDSYANCMLPMLTPYYDKIIVIDPRYFYDNIYDVMQIYEINEVLFLYNANSFAEDNSLADVLKNKQ